MMRQSQLICLRLVSVPILLVRVVLMWDLQTVVVKVLVIVIGENDLQLATRKKAVA